MFEHVEVWNGIIKSGPCRSNIYYSGVQGNAMRKGHFTIYAYCIYRCRIYESLAALFFMIAERWKALKHSTEHSTAATRTKHTRHRFSPAHHEWIWASQANPLETRQGGLSVSRERSDDFKDAASVSRKQSQRDTGGLEGQTKTGSPIAARSTVEDKQCRLRNWDKTMPAKATSKQLCCLLFALCFLVFFFLGVNI